MRKKYFIAVLAVIFCCAIYSPANASDSEIAKTYLRRAMASRDNPQILSRMINEAKEYEYVLNEINEVKKYQN